MWHDDRGIGATGFGQVHGFVIAPAGTTSGSLA
jgi:hypothetical protein